MEERDMLILQEDIEAFTKWEAPHLRIEEQGLDSIPFCNGRDQNHNFHETLLLFSWLMHFRFGHPYQSAYNLAMPEWLGKTIGKVRIEKLLARGGMAEVYLGIHLTLERPVAIKLLHSYIEEEPLLLERFNREARAVAGLRHPNIVQIFDFDTIDSHPYIVMEYLRGP